MVREGRLLLLVASCGAAVALAASCDTDDPPKPPPPKPLVVTPAPGGIRRLTSSQIRNTISDLLGSNAASVLELSTDPQLHGFASIAAAENAISPTDVSTYESTFSDAIDQALMDLTPIETLVPCVQNPTDACYGEVARTFGRAAWRRPLADDEAAVLVSIAENGEAANGGSFDDGLHYELSAILQSPNFLYMVEVGVPNASGFRALDDYELASRMAFFLTDRAPDAELIDVADRGGLSTDDAIRTQAKRLLQKPEAQDAFDRFVGEMYLIDDLSDVSKDPGQFPEWNASLSSSMKTSYYDFIRDIVWTRNADARELFTSSDYFVDANLAKLYGVDPPATGFAKVTIPPAEKRAGILGQAGFLARFAHPGLTSPTRRGRFVEEVLLCNDMPSPPPGQNTNIPAEAPGQPETMRQRLAQHEQDMSCAICHSRMDPIGFALENYDAIGKYRADDRGMPLDTSGHEPDLGSFASAADIGAALSKSDTATKCMVKNLIRSSMGHLETPGETDAIADLDTHFAASGHSFQSLMVELCASPAFRLVGDPK